MVSFKVDQVSQHSSGGTEENAEFLNLAIFCTHSATKISFQSQKGEVT